MNALFDCPGNELPNFTKMKDRFGDLKGKRHLPFTDADAYRLLKAATEAFVMVNCGVVVADNQAGRFFNRLSKDADAYLDRRDLPSERSQSELFNALHCPTRHQRSDAALSRSHPQ